MTVPYEDLINKAYAAFNARDIDTALSTMHADVQWPKAFEGSYVTGHDEIRDYIQCTIIGLYILLLI